MAVTLRRRATVVGALGVWVLASLPGAQTQTTGAICLSNFDFLFNSLGQSPCLVAAYASSTCNSAGKYNVPALAAGDSYQGPSPNYVSKCQCSSVVYSLFGACGVCQNRSIITWSSWHTNCKNVYLAVLDENIPPGTTIPAWAYANVSIKDIFDPSYAMTSQLPLQDLPPESSTSHTNQVTNTNSGGANPTSNVSNSTKSSITGAIAGSVIGGIVVFSFVALLAFFLIRRRNNKTRNIVEPRTHLMAAQIDLPSPDQSFISGGANGDSGHSVQPQDGGQQQQHMGEYNTPVLTVRRLPTLPIQRIFDQNDSSTIHSSLAPPSFVSHYTQPPHYPGDITTIPDLHRDA